MFVNAWINKQINKENKFDLKVIASRHYKQLEYALGDVTDVKHLRQLSYRLQPRIMGIRFKVQLLMHLPIQSHKRANQDTLWRHFLKCAPRMRRCWLSSCAFSSADSQKQSTLPTRFWSKMRYETNKQTYSHNRIQTLHSRKDLPNNTE